MPKQGTGGHLWLVASLDAAVPQRGGKSKNLPLNFFQLQEREEIRRKKNNPQAEDPTEQKKANLMSV